MMLRPGDATLAEWRDIYRGAAVTLDPASQPHVAASAEAVARILSEDVPIYGINTGFGRLASVRIPLADLERLQRNIVLSHAAGTGQPVPQRCRPPDDRVETCEPGTRRFGHPVGDPGPARRDADARRDPGDPLPGVGRCVRRSRAARAHGRGDDRGG